MKIVAGGPLVYPGTSKLSQVDHLILNEAEITLPLFLRDLSEGHPERIYKTTGFPDITSTPVPDFHLIVKGKLCLYEYPGFARMPIFL